MHTGYLALGSGHPGWRDPSPEGLAPASAIREVGPWLGRVWLGGGARGGLHGVSRGPHSSPTLGARCKNVPRDKESARVLIGFIGQSLPGRAPKHERGKSGGLQPAGRGGAPTYPGGCRRSGTFSHMAGIRL